MTIKIKNVSAQYDDIISSQIEYIKTLKNGSEEKQKAVEELDKLVSMRNQTKSTFNDLKWIVPAISQIGMGLLCLNFEKTGTITSFAGRETLRGLFRPRKE